MGMYASGNSSTTRGFSDTLLPPIGIIDIDSSPPAMPTSMPPAAMRSATIDAACTPCVARVTPPRRDAVGDDRRRLQPRRAEAVDRHGRRLIGHSRQEAN